MHIKKTNSHKAVHAELGSGFQCREPTLVGDTSSPESSEPCLSPGSWSPSHRWKENRPQALLQAITKLSSTNQVQTIDFRIGFLCGLTDLDIQFLKQALSPQIEKLIIMLF